MDSGSTEPSSSWSAGTFPVTSLYRAFDRDVAIRVDAGESGGRLLVIGDPTFPTDRVLENEHDAWEGNVSFLAAMLAAGAGR